MPLIHLQERMAARSAESKYIIMDYLKNKAPYNIKRSSGNGTKRSCNIS